MRHDDASISRRVFAVWAIFVLCFHLLFPIWEAPRDVLSDHDRQQVRGFVLQGPRPISTSEQLFIHYEHTLVFAFAWLAVGAVPLLFWMVGCDFARKRAHRSAFAVYRNGLAVAGLWTAMASMFSYSPEDGADPSDPRALLLLFNSIGFLFPISGSRSFQTMVLFGYLALPSTFGVWYQMRIERKAAEPGATDNPDDAQRLREDH